MQLKKTLIVVSFFVFAMSMAGVGNIWAQSCSDENIDVAALLQKANKSNSGSMVYEIAAVAGDGAIDELREFADEKKYPYISSSARAALAKLGDNEILEASWSNLREHEVFRVSPIVPLLGRVGDERAVRMVMKYLIENQDGNAQIFRIAEGMRIIAKKRHVPKMPSRDSREKTDKEYINEWVQWWEQNKDVPVGRPVYESVENPYLRCLARKVEWGFHGALRSIADYGGAEAEATLRKFPSPPSHAYNYAINAFLADLSAALAKIGDQQEFDKIVDNLRNRQSYNVPTITLRYIGDKRALEALIEALGIPYNEKMREKDSDEWNEHILNALARMVQNAPLGYGAEPTEENFNIWRKWWETKRDIAVIIPYNKQQR